jgi:hypothetical protein
METGCVLCKVETNTEKKISFYLWDKQKKYEFSNFTRYRLWSTINVLLIYKTLYNVRSACPGKAYLKRTLSVLFKIIQKCKIQEK